MGTRTRENGFTIAELMIALVIMAIVTSQALLMFTTQHRTYVGQGQTTDIQQEARLVTEMILSDVRMAGFLVQNTTAISGFDGGATNPDRLCVSDPSAISAPVITAAVGPLAGATVDAVLGAGAGTVNLDAGSMDIDGDGFDDFPTNSGIIISDGLRHHCARITGAGASGPDFAPNTEAGFTVPAGARAVPAVIYELTVNGLMRNGVLLSSQVENLQFEYAVDIDGDGTIGAGEFPIHDVQAQDPTEIKGVQISVLTRTPDEDPQSLGSRMPRAANHDPGALDNFLRRRFTANAVPRNI
jgi:prepilin-type N-terminal cleavage/methylation domain-containing protein